ncbi:MAG TPA: sigma factor-like helix-turn-helix DNA-binding protein, partial [Minicystis sp.]|nr:sigma factor-like helix-turn-helix DNA-binding protein [Minicystis sp.]
MLALVGSAPGGASEEEAARLALAGRAEAWDALIARHDRRVVLSLVARGVRLDRARDLAQETWARLVAQQRAGKLERLDLPGLAIAQAAFLARDEARRRRAASDAAPIDAVVELADPAAPADERLASREHLDRARAELERCSPAARRVFEAVYEDPDAPHAEAAARLGLSVQRVRQTLCEVRAR